MLNLSLKFVGNHFSRTDVSRSAMDIVISILYSTTIYQQQISCLTIVDDDHFWIVVRVEDFINYIRSKFLNSFFIDKIILK